MNDQNEHDMATACAPEDACRFLAASLYEPDAAFIEEDLFGSLATALSSLDAALANSARGLGADFVATDQNALLIDYTRLFLGPIQPPAAPYGSLWLGGDPGLMLDSTQAVVELYAEAGFELDDEIHDLPDHLAIELECLYALLFKARIAKHEGDAQAATVAEGLARRLIHEHLARWVGPFADALEQSAETAYYRRLAGLLRAFVALLAARFPVTA